MNLRFAGDLLALPDGFQGVSQGAPTRDGSVMFSSPDRSPAAFLSHQIRKGRVNQMGHGIIAWIIIGVLAGWITGKIMKGSGYGFFMDMIVGLVGALVGGFLSSHLGLGGVGQHGLIVSILIAVVGAVIFTWILRLISGNR
jgi:uncharacterized membrane protein YeaQ/YmgE (transglycosylase-associated protein family)